MWNRLAMLLRHPHSSNFVRSYPALHNWKLQPRASERARLSVCNSSTNSISQCQTQKDVKKLQLYTCNFALLCPGLQYQLSNHVISMGGITVYGIMSSPLQIQDNYIRLESLECTLHSPLAFSLSFETMVQRGPQNLCGRFCSFSTGYILEAIHKVQAPMCK